MRTLSSIVLPSTTLMVAVDPKVVGGGAIGAQVVRDQSIGNEAVFLQKFSNPFQRGMLVSLGLDQHIEDWRVGLAQRPERARAFYLTIALATLVGAGLNFTP